DVTLGGADRAAYADLAFAQHNTNQHDVHDDDAANDHGNGADQDEHSEESSADAAPQSHVAFLGADEEIVLHLAAKVVACAQDQLRLILRLFKQAFTRFHINRQAGMDAMNAEKHGERNGDEVVLVLAKDAPDFFHDPDDHELVVADSDAFADSVDAKEKFLDQGITDEANVDPVLGFGGCEVTAKLDRARVDVGHTGRLAVKADILGFFVAVARSHGSAGSGANLLTSPAAVVDGPHVVQLDLLVLECLNDDV